MTTKNNSLAAIENLKCTPKALEQVQSYTNTHELSGRERQCLFLMMRNDALSMRALEKFISKVDIPSLIRRGYLSIINEDSDNSIGVDGEEVLSAGATVDDKASNIDPNVHPGLVLLSGNLE